MKKTNFFLILLPVLVVVSGCEPKHEMVSTNKDSICKLSDLKFKEAYIYRHVNKTFIEKDGYSQSTYEYKVSIKEPEKINTIIECICEANLVNYKVDKLKNQKGYFQTINFKKGNKIYYTNIYWNDEFVFGELWEPEKAPEYWKSTDLFNYFRQWGLFDEISKSEPNHPPKWKVNTRTKENDPNFPGVKRFEPNSSQVVIL
jgi:hypothetical protein